MDILKNILSQQIIQNLGWTLVHFVWQAVAVALLLAILLRLLRKSSANLRYIIACIALALIVLMPAATLKMLDAPAETIEPVELVPVDLPKAEFDSPPIVQTPPIETTPPLQPAAAPKVPLKDKFVAAVDSSLPFIVVAWLVGVFCLSIWHLGGWAQLQRLRRKMVKQVGERVNQRLKYLAEKLGIKRTVEIAESALVQVPAVVGWLRPVILLPATALTGLSGEQLEAILAHELAHIKRCDYLVNMLQTAVEILGFYHPAVWWVSHKIRAERENCCDDLAVSVSGDRVAYAKALTSMEQVRTGYTLAVAADGGGLFDRIRRLLAKDSANQTKISWLPSAIAIMLIASLLIPVCFAMSDSLKPESETAAQEEQKELSEFEKTLPNGVTVELVGICEYPSASKQWWRPDGNLLNQQIVTVDTSNYTSKAPAYEIAYRITAPDDATISNYFRIERTLAQSDLIVKKPSGLRAKRAQIDEWSKTTTVAFGIAAGQWKTIGKTSGKGHTNIQIGSGKLMFGPAEGTKEKLILTVSDNIGTVFRYDYRLIGIDSSGNVFHPSSKSGNLKFMSYINPLHESTFVFTNLKPDSIDHFEFQTRPYEWAEFKNVSLKPNFKTDEETAGIYSIRHFVRVVTDDESQRVTFEGRELDTNGFPDNLEPLLENVPDRAHTVLEIGFAPGTMPEKGSVAWLGIVHTLDRLQEKFGFEYLSNVGEHPLGSKGGSTQTYCRGILRFDQYIPFILQSAEQPPLLKCRSIKFEKIDDTIVADVSMLVASYPKTRWEFRLRLLDAESNEINAAYHTFENSGFSETNPDLTEEDLQLLMGTSDDFENAKKFELRIRQIEIGNNTLQVERKGKNVQATKLTSSFTRDGILNIWQDQERRLHDIYINFDFEETIKGINGKVKASKRENIMYMSKGNLFRTRKQVFVPKGSSHVANDWEFSADGMRKYYCNRTGSHPHGTVENSLPEQAGIKDNWVVHYLSCVYRMPRKKGNAGHECNLIGALEEAKTIEVTEELFEGRKAVVLNRPNYSKVYLDPMRNLAVLGSEATGDLTFKCRNSNFVEVADGIWMPLQTERTFKQGSDLVIRKTKVKKLKVNNNYTKEDFRIKFGPGIMVRDINLKPHVQVEDDDSAARLRDEELSQRSESLKKLRSLGLLLIMYADDHDERYPYGLELIKRYDYKDEVVSWALENVGYLGRGRSAAVEPQALIAYDKTMLLEKGCTNLLFNDSHVEFCEKKRVKDTKFGGSSLLDIENRWNSAQNLSDLGKAMLIFACNHDDRYPQSLDELSKTDWFGKTELDWLKENVEYLGYKEKATSLPAAVLAYDKTLLKKGQGTNVLYNDCRVKFEKPEQLKKLGIITKEKPAPQMQIRTSAYIVTVPSDIPRLKEFIPDDKSETKMITYEKLEEFLKVLSATPKVRQLFAPGVITNDGEAAELRVEDVNNFEFVQLNVKSTVAADRRTILFELDFTCALSVGNDLSLKSKSIAEAVSPDHAVSVVVAPSLDGQTILLLVKPQILENQSSKTGVVAPDGPESEKEISKKDGIEITARLLLLPVDANEIAGFFEDKSLEDALVKTHGDPDLKSYSLTDKQVEQLIMLSNTNPDSKLLTLPEVVVNDWEDATIRNHKTIRYTVNSANSDESEVKELNVGTIFQVTPRLEQAGRIISLDFKLEHTSLIDFDEDNLPRIETSEIASRISVPDGETLLLGGQKLTDKQDGREVQKVLWHLIKAVKLEPDNS